MMKGINLIVSIGYQELIISRAETTSKNFADLLTNSIFQMMRRGWTRSEVEEFIRGMASGKETDRAIVMSIATLAKGLGIKMVAEYVEDGEVLKAVEEVGMDYAQGFSNI